MSHNFIGIYENVIPDNVCDEFINFFESCDKLGFVKSRQQREDISKLQKHDDSVFVTDILHLHPHSIINSFTDLFWSVVYKQYLNEYAILNSVGEHSIYECKLQRTPVGGGYHMWHCEQGAKNTSDRILTFTVYLNDVEEGGETEFLYYPKRIAAKKGTVVLFPGGFTHAHRGNPPLSNVKYIVTGWVQFRT